MSNRSPPPRTAARQDSPPGFDPLLNDVATGERRQELWIDHLRHALAAQSPQARDIAEEALRAWPANPELLLLAALAALAEALPERAFTLLKRYVKRYGPGKPAILLTALSLAQQGQFTRAWSMLLEAGLHTGRAALPWFVGDDVMEGWLYAQLQRIQSEQLQSPSHAGARAPRKPRTVVASLPAPPRPAKPAPLQASAIRSPRSRAPEPPVVGAELIVPVT